MSTRLLGVLLTAVFLCVAPHAAGASESIDTLLRRADTLRSSDPDKFQTLMRELDARRAEGTRQQQDLLAYLDAYAMAYAGNYDIAIANLQRLTRSSADIDIRFRAGALIVHSYAVTKQFTDGLRELQQVMPMLPKVKDPEVRDHGLAVASLLYGKMGQYALALRYAEQMLAGTGSGRARCFAGQYRIDALQNLGQLPKNDAPILKVIEQCRNQGESIVTAMTRSNLARKWAAQGKINEAIALLKSNMAEVEATHYPAVIGELHSVLAEYLLIKGNLSEAETNAQTAVEQRSDSGFSWYLVSAYKTLFEVAERRHDPVSALQHYQRYAEADKAYLTEVKTRELAYQVVRQETSQKTQEIELLNRKNEVLRLQQRVDRQSAQSSRLVALLLLVLLGSIGYWAYKIKRVQSTLRRWAETDSLTGICNRHHFTLLSEQTLAQCARSGEIAAVVMFDLDHFKSINDRFGHVTGDWVLKAVADACKTFCRRIDHLGRLGGEEFAFLLQGCDVRDAVRMANDCRVRLAAIDTTASGHRFAVTASFGVTATPLSGYDLARLLSHADQMLYRAKREGRNRVCAFDGDNAGAFKDYATTRYDDPSSGPPMSGGVPLSA
ncbi:MAG: GGDEF domain-containing protein [Luteimonas sp.]